MAALMLVSGITCKHIKCGFRLNTKTFLQGVRNSQGKIGPRICIALGIS